MKLNLINENAAIHSVGREVKVFLALLVVLRPFADQYCSNLSHMFPDTVYKCKLKIQAILSSIFPFNKGEIESERSYVDQHCCNVCHIFKLILQIQLKGAIDYVFLSLFPPNKGETLLLVSLRF